MAYVEQPHGEIPIQCQSDEIVQTHGRKTFPRQRTSRPDGCPFSVATF